MFAAIALWLRLRSRDESQNWIGFFSSHMTSVAGLAAALDHVFIKASLPSHHALLHGWLITCFRTGLWLGISTGRSHCKLTTRKVIGRSRRISMKLLVYLCSSILLVSSLAGQQSEAALAKSTEQFDAAFDRLRSADMRLARVAYRLTSGNEALCDKHMTSTGLVIQAIDQFPLTIRDEVRTFFKFSSRFAIEGIVAGSPAEAAGLREGDGIVAVNGRELETKIGVQADSTGRDQLVAEIQAIQIGQGTELTLLRAKEYFKVTLPTKLACKTRVEIVAGSPLVGQSDGQTIQLGEQFVTEYGDDAVAAIFAHELAHTILRHRERLEAAGVKKGALGQFGKSLRLNRRAETEADELSVYLLAHAGFDPDIAPQFWEMNGRQFDYGIFRDPAYASPKKRAAAMRQAIAQMSESYGSSSLAVLVASRDLPMN